MSPIARIRIVRKQTIERNYECARCGTRAVATVRARGETAWRKPILFDDYQVADARSDAAYAMQDDADRILSLMHCPGCGQRAPRAVMWSAVRLTIWGAIGALALLATFVANGIFSLPTWVFAAAVGLGVALTGTVEARRWLAAAKGDRTFADIRPPAGEKALPQAIAREVPRAPARPAAPIAPLRTEAPDREGAPQGDRPRLLK